MKIKYIKKVCFHDKVVLALNAYKEKKINNEKTSINKDLMSFLNNKDV